MEITVLKSGAYMANCYVFYQENRALLIDCGVDYSLIADFLRSKNLVLEMILLTHGHFDHCQCAHEFKDIPIYISKNDYDLAVELRTIKPFNARFYSEEKPPKFCGNEFRIIETAGHSAGSVCIEFCGKLYSGDTLFSGAVGRTDLPTGSLTQLKNSIEMLLEMYENIEVFPGHGGSTTLKSERETLRRYFEFNS